MSSFHRFFCTLPPRQGIPLYGQLLANRIGKYWMRIPGVQGVGYNEFTKTINVMQHYQI